MNRSRIRLTRIIAFNWYGFRTIIDVNGLTLLCGETGTGKSALLDLVQYVMSAGSTKFNKAAAGETNSRDLRGYCLCDTRTRTADGKKRYLRRNGATVAALEFSWPAGPEEEPRRETWGIRIQFESPSADPTFVRFTVPCRLERADLCDETGDLMSEELFRRHLKDGLGGDPRFTSHKAFQEEMGVPRHLDYDDEQMRKTLPKAIAFELGTDYQRFIREFILEPSTPDVVNTRRSLDALRQAEARVNQLDDQLRRLERIAEADQKYQDSHREAALFKHLRQALYHSEGKEKHDRIETSLKALRERHAENQSKMEEAVAARKAAQQQLESIKFTAGKEDLNLSDLDRFTREKDEVEEQIQSLESKARSARDYLNDKARAWEQWLAQAATMGIEATVDPQKLRALRDPDVSRALDGVARLLGEFHSVQEAANDHLRPKLNEITSLGEKRTHLNEQLALLKAGRTSPTPLLDELNRRGFTASSLARIVEILEPGEAWWGTIEALLGNDRSALVVNSLADYLQARDLWIQMPDAEPLVHPDEIPGDPPIPDALARFVEVSHPVARRFVDWKLGQISAVREPHDLTTHSHAATPQGAVKEAAVLRHVTPEAELTLGDKGLQRLRSAKESQLADVVLHLSELEHERDEVRRWLRRGKESKLDQNDTPPNTSDLHQLGRHRETLDRLRKSIKVIETPELNKRLALLRQFESAWEGANQTIGKLTDPITDFTVNEGQLKDDLKAAGEELLELGIKLQESRENLPPGIRDQEIAELIAASLKAPGSWKQRRDQAELGQTGRQKEAESARLIRQQERLELLAHPEHRDELGEFDAQEENNDRFDQRLHQIREHEVTHYKTIAADRRVAWEKRLQEDVISSLSEKLKDARRTVEDFRRILNREIGGYRYKLSQTRDHIHRAMWTLIDHSGDGFQSSDALIDWKLQDEIEETKRALMHTLDHPEDSRAASLLDYRNYHRYDLQMIPTGFDDDSEGKISLQESGSTGSGGEGQAPFFVAMLAAFHRVYDRGQRGGQPNLGLVVMDEAFSKLSAGHISDCLALAEGFGLQLILAFPMDRLGTMVQHADSIIQCRMEKKADSKGAPVHIVNDVIYWQREEVASELLA